MLKKITIEKKACMVLLIGIAGFVMSFLNIGCGGGKGGGGSITVDGEDSEVASSSLQTSFDRLNQGDYLNAIRSFESFISSNSSSGELARAYGGLGWSYLKLGDIMQAAGNLEKADQSSVDTKVGLASCYLARGGYSNARTSLELLESAGFADASYSPDSLIKTGITDGELKAFMAFLYYLRNNPGDDEKADAMKARARSAGASSGNAKAIMDALISLGF